MSDSQVVFEAGQWQLYEWLLLLCAFLIVLLAVFIGYFKPLDIFRWTMVLMVSFSLIWLCFLSRKEAMSVASLQTKGNHIEVLDGEFRYGNYRFTFLSKHGIDYREIMIDERSIKIYHSGYLPSNRCYRDLFSSNQFREHTRLRLLIYWHKHRYSYGSSDYTLMTPCIVRVEQLYDNSTVTLASRS